MAKAINAKDKAGRAAGRRGHQDGRGRQASWRRTPSRPPTWPTSWTRSSTGSCGPRCWTRASGWTGAISTPCVPSASRPGLLPRTHGSALFTRGETQALVAVTLGTVRRRAADRQHRRGRRDHQVVHAALQLPALLDRRSAADPRHQPPRDRPRGAGGAGAAAAAAGLREVPLHPAGRLRDPRVQRLLLDGHRLRRLAVADGRGRADEGALRRRGDGAGQGRARRSPS